AMLKVHAWPGNVRELANAVQKALIFNRGAPIQAHEILQAVGADPGRSRGGGGGELDDLLRQWLRQTIAGHETANTFDAIMDRVARLLVGEALAITQGNRSQAARLLGLSRPTLHAKIDKFGIKLKTSVQGSAEPEDKG
ncbi:MAG TPA: helix-turn-helix domain-containing protein, partial [Desulfobacterales bacterium]|nr:helix-turn-helix domain-containing protein [Desulfobacterales bacterium]